MANTINLSVVAQNRKRISVVGATLGTQYFKTEARSCDNTFEEKAQQVKANGNVDFILNRVPRRFRMTGHEILSTEIVSDAVGATKVVLNGHDENACVSIPVGANMEKIGTVTDDAIGKALKGDKNIIFADPKKLCAMVNQLNQDERARLVAQRDFIDRCIQQIDSAITENAKKEQTYTQECINSTPEIIPTPSASTEESTVVVLND